MMDITYPYVSRKRFDNTEGVNDAWTLTVNAIGKDNHDNPYLIPNEWISANIAHSLGIPVPSFAIMGKRSPNNAMFASISFEGSTAPRDVEPPILWEKLPLICTGIIVFDILIANGDRHSGNIKVDNPANPKRVYIFDHDRALFYTSPGQGIDRLENLTNRLGISGGSVSGGSRHCLIDEIDTLKYFEYWLRRAEEMSPLFIDDACKTIYKLGANRKEVQAASKFLIDRKRKLGDLIYNNKAAFPAISVKEWEGRLFL